MRIIGVDFETYYDDEYSLSKLTTEMYVRDNRFEVIGVSVKTDAATPAIWFSGSIEETSAFLDSVINWGEDAVLCHNAAFDGAIMSWVFGRHPKLWFDTLSMARPTHLKTIGVSLWALARHYKVGEKGSAALDAKGKRRKDFTPEELAEYGVYCCNDTELTYKLFKIFAASTPPLELQVIDATIRMFTEPKLRLNKQKLQEYLDEVVANKEALITAANEQNRDNFMSNDLFAQLLIAEGVEPPQKWSEKQKKMVFAFAKTDKGMKDLLDHENPRVQALVACRLGVKTTIEETRTARLIDISTRGLFPVMLNYWGAGTGRFSGGDKVNPQNFKRGGKIRDAIEAPAGHCVVASDLSQIEARILALVAGQQDLVEAFADPNRDPYCELASEFYGKPVTKADKEERFVGKTGTLGLGYYTGAAKLRETLRIGQGGISVTVPLEEAKRYVDSYRKKNYKIKEFWSTCGRALDQMVLGGSGYISEQFDIRYKGSTVILPNGSELYYPGLEYHVSEETGERELRYLNRGQWTKIYSGLLCENIIQALARGVIVEYLVTVANNYTVVLQVHDEIVCVVPLDKETEAKTYIEKVMSIPVSWLPGLPVACEIKAGASYGDAK